MIKVKIVATQPCQHVAIKPNPPQRRNHIPSITRMYRTSGLLAIGSLAAVRSKTAVIGG